MDKTLRLSERPARKRVRTVATVGEQCRKAKSVFDECMSGIELRAGDQARAIVATLKRCPPSGDAKYLLKNALINYADGAYRRELCSVVEKLLADAK